MSEVKEHSVIYLAPACHEDHMQREWCEDDVWSACEECGSENTSVRYNLGTDFDRVTAERDAERRRADVAVADANDAEAAGKKVSELLATRTAERDEAQAKAEMFYQKQRQAEIQLQNANSRIESLQQRLTAADERADVLETALAGKAALKPAEGWWR